MIRGKNLEMNMGMSSEQFLVLNMCLNNKKIKKFFSREWDTYISSGETKTLYEKMSAPNIILRLMDNRNFIVQDNDTKKEMIYSDYYPSVAKTSLDVYYDDRRNLCQELHNKVAKELGIPETLVVLEDFKNTDMDYDMFQFYNPNTGKIHINTAIKHHECDKIELAEAVIRATYMHELYYRVRTKFLIEQDLDDKQKYLLNSLLLKLYVVETLKQNKKNKEANEIAYNDGYSSGYVYATYKAYEYLDKFIKDNKLDEKIDFSNFYECLISYKASLVDMSEGSDDDEDEDYEEDYDQRDCLLYDTISFDLDLLYDVESFDLNIASDGAIVEHFLDNMSETANDFYSFFGYEVENFREEYEQFKDESKMADELQEEIDEALDE